VFGSPEEKRPLGRRMRLREDNIKMYLRETRWKRVDQIHLAHDRNKWRAPANAAGSLQVP